MKRIMLMSLIVALVVLAGATVFAGGETEKKAAEPTGPVTVRYMDHQDRFGIYPALGPDAGTLEGPLYMIKIGYSGR